MADEVKHINEARGQFGVGCVHFRPKKPEQGFDSFDAYVGHLKSSLTKIAAIQDIQLDAENSLHSFKTGLPCPFALLEDSEYPDLASCTGVFFEITLTLTIPERTQREILETEGWAGWSPANLITAYFAYQYDTPIMLVYLEEEKDGQADPSSCVRLVREFLRLEMEGNPACEFTVDTLGPSPFHSDFTIQTSNELHDGIRWDRTVKRGYDTVSITVPSSVKSFRELVRHLDDAVFDDFDLFYMIILERSRVMDSWHHCFSAVKEFEEHHRKAAKFRRALSWLFPIGNTYELVSKIADFRLVSMSAAGRINDRITNNAFIQESVIWKDIDTEMKTFPKYDIDSLEKLVDFIDRKQIHRQTGANTFFAAIAGGAAGALITWLMQAGIHNSLQQLPLFFRHL